MFDPTKRHFLFKCEDCDLIVAVDLETEEDLLDVQEDKISLRCPCDGECRVLRD